MYYIVVTVYYISRNNDKVYRYKDLIWRIRCCSVDNEIIGFLIIGEVMWKIMFTKNRTMSNVYARMNCIRSIDTVRNFWTIRVV